MVIKVLLDSNVLISASVYVTYVEDFNSPFKHEFFDIAMSLIGQLKRQIGKRIGIVTSTIENEVHSVFNRCVLTTLRECRPDSSEKEIFDFASIVLNKCEDRLISILNIMMREPILEEHIASLLPKVDHMYQDLVSLARSTDIQDIAYTKAGGASKRFQKSAYDVYLTEETDRYMQLMRLLEKSPSRTDREILAEAAYLYNLYRRLSDVEFYLASCDLAFSPMGPSYCSNMVTSRIYSEFNVICHWPSEVAKQLQKKLN